MEDIVAENKNKYYRLFFWGVLALTVILGAAFVLFRIIDADEGFYLSAGSLLAEGFQPYIDFFFPQMPYVVPVLAPLNDLGLSGLFIARALGFLFHLLLGVLVYFFSGYIFSEKPFRLGMLFLFLLCGPLLTYNSLAKPYFFSNLFAAGSFVLLAISLRRTEINYKIVFGIFALLAVAINFRLIFVVFVALYFFICYFYYRRLPGFNFSYYLLAFLGGLIVPSAYSIYLLVGDPGRFLFNAIGYHMLRGGAPEFGQMMIHKLEVIGKLLIQPHYLLPLALAFWSQMILNSRKYAREFDNWHRAVSQLALVIAAFLFVAYMIPYPVNVHYYHQSLLFVLISSFPAVKILSQKTAAIKSAFLSFYLVTFIIYPLIYIFDIRDRFQDYDIDHVRRVTEMIRANSEQDDTVLSEWVGYNVFAQRPQVEGEGFSGFQYDFGTALIPYSRYRILTDDLVNDLLRNGDPHLVIINNYVIPAWEKELEKNYDILVKIDDTFIYERESQDELN